jgi:hypothetical protein
MLNYFEAPKPERADYLGPDGYRYIDVPETDEFEGGTFHAEEVVWLMQTRKWPERRLIHINGRRDDNRWANLKLSDDPADLPFWNRR